ncbi:MAG: glycoside hydrolase family 15 protein [bacterium]
MKNKFKKSDGSFYGIIGNGETCALVSHTGAIDWFCIPRFDSPFVFGRLVDNKSGTFEIKPIGNQVINWQQKYQPDAAILETECQGANGDDIFTITDWMPWGKRELRRLITPNRPEVELEIYVLPTFDYRRAEHFWTHRSRTFGGVSYENFTAKTDDQLINMLLPSAAVRLESGAEYDDADSALKLHIKINSPAEIILSYDGDSEPDTDHNAVLDKEVSFWKSWLSKSTYDGEYADEFRRSLITMKLLTYTPTGAILAAATTSLPQHPGTGSNWDYRLAWIRDGVFAAAAYLEAGFTEEAKTFIDFVFSVMNCKPCEKPWQPVYCIDGNPDCREEDLEHLSGFLGDCPVRIGNLAYAQLQHDAEGEVIEVLWDIYEHTHDLEYLKKHWDRVQTAAQYVIDNWMKEDNGIWELRRVKWHFTHSKVMCWTALDRAARIAEVLGHSSFSILWQKAADTIHSDLMRFGWNHKMRAFTLGYDMPITDTSVLAIPLTGMLEPDHPKVRTTVRRIEKELVYDNLVARNIFEPTPFPLVTYWLARYYIMAGQNEKARAIIDRTIAAMTDLKLFREHLMSGEEVPKLDFGVMLKCGVNLLTAYDSFNSLLKLFNSLYRYYRYRNPSRRKGRERKLTPQEKHLFRGNFPQVYCHEELVRVLVRLGI